MPFLDDLTSFANDYWSWLSSGASLYQLNRPAPTLPSGMVAPQSESYVDVVPIAEGVLHYVRGVGYVKESDLQKYDPRGFAAIAKQRQTEAANPTINPYWEKSRVQQPLRQLSPGPLVIGTPSQPQTGQAGAGGAGAGGGAAAGGGGVNYSPGTGNRVGNTATTSVPGQTAVTPNQWSGDYQQQARERSAKRMGRDISQAGITKVPNVKEDYSRRVRQNFRKY